MISESALQKIEALASQVAEREGVVIYDIEFAGGGSGRTLRVYIDKADGNPGIEDCTNVSRGLNLLLDVEDPIPGGRYNLEVSTPGLDRQLKKAWHFEKVLGKKIWIRLNRSLESLGIEHKRLKTAKQISDVLQSIEKDTLKMNVEGEEIQIPLSAVDKAKLVFEFAETKGPKDPHSANPKKAKNQKNKK